jgi:hypothetical protein
MENHQKHINDLSEIRSMMERASKFISLSGISGISAGIVALIGAALAYWFLYIHLPLASSPLLFYSLSIFEDSVVTIFLLACVVFSCACLLAVIFTTRNSRRKKLPIWDYSSKRVLVHLMVPLVSGAFIIMALVYYKCFELVIPSSLIFYGFALINSGHFTFRDIKILGFIEIFIGIAALFLVEWGLILWSLGFGLLHIIYGAIMYFKYER